MAKQTELTKAKRSAPSVTTGRWKLENAKARFSEVVRRARREGPQRVSVRGHDAVVMISVEEFERLAPEKPRLPFLEFMESLHLRGLDLELEINRGLDVEL